MADAISPYFQFTDCPLCQSAKKRQRLALTYGDLKQKKGLDYRPIGIDGNSPFQVLECRSCGFVYANPRIRPEFESMVYNECKLNQHNRAAEQNQHLNLLGRKRKIAYLGPLSEALSFLPSKKPDWQLLDFGCGYGDLLAVTKELGVDAYGVDIDEQRLQLCRERGLNVAQPDALETIFPDLRADVIMWMSNIEHLLDPRAAAAYLADKCAPGAILYVDGLKPRIIDMERRKGMYTKAHFIEHINYFPTATLNAFLAEYGFQPLPKRNWVMVDTVKTGLKRTLIALLYGVLGENPLSGHFARLYRYQGPTT